MYFVENFRRYDYYCGSINYDQYGTLGAQWLLTLIAS